MWSRVFLLIPNLTANFYRDRLQIFTDIPRAEDRRKLVEEAWRPLTGLTSHANDTHLLPGLQAQRCTQFTNERYDPHGVVVRIRLRTKWPGPGASIDSAAHAVMFLTADPL